MATAESIPLVFNSDKPNISVKLNNNVLEELILKTESIRIVPITSVKNAYKVMSVINATFKIKKLNGEQVKAVKKEISSGTIYNKLSETVWDRVSMINLCIPKAAFILRYIRRVRRT